MSISRPAYEAYAREQLLPALGNITEEQWMKMHDRQLAKTLELLANGYPMYNVNIDQPTPEITFTGLVGQKAA